MLLFNKKNKHYILDVRENIEILNQSFIEMFFLVYNKSSQHYNYTKPYNNLKISFFQNTSADLDCSVIKQKPNSLNI